MNIGSFRIIKLIPDLAKKVVSYLCARSGEIDVHWAYRATRDSNLLLKTVFW